MMTKIYMVFGGLAVATYLGVAAQGIVFSGTDGRPEIPSKSGSSGRRPGVGFWWWGVGGYRGGK